MGKRVLRTTYVSIGLAGFLAGLLLARAFGYVPWHVLVMGIVTLSPLLRLCTKLSLLSIALIGLLVGVWRGQVFMHTLLPYQQLSKKPVTIVATATTDAVYGDKKQLEFDVGSIKLETTYRKALPGVIGVRGYGEAMVYRGDSVQVSAKLYPARGSRLGRLSFSRITVVARDASWVNRLRRRFAAGVQSVLPEPLGSLGLGLLVGQRTTLPDWLNTNLSMVGLTHIVAVSGYNLTILVNLVRKFGRTRSKFQRTLTTLLFISLFVVLAGSSASMVRAGAVSILSLWAAYHGHRFKPHVLILLVAALSAGWFPVYIWQDVGWYLSFLAFVGVLILAPLLARRLFANKPQLLGQLLLETIAAQVMTLPIILLVFGRLSFIALLANLLVVPMVPLAMLLSFVAGLAALVVPTVAGWFAWPANLVLRYVVDVSQTMANIPHASVGASMTWWQALLAYVVLCSCVLMWWQKGGKNGMIHEVNASAVPKVAPRVQGKNHQEIVGE